MKKYDVEVGKDKVRKVRVGAGNFLSQLVFFWLFSFIWTIRRANNFKNLHLYLRKTETAIYNDEILAKKWKVEVSKAEKENK